MSHCAHIVVTIAVTQENLKAYCRRRGSICHAGKYCVVRQPITLLQSRALPAKRDYLHEVDYPEVLQRKWFVQALTWLWMNGRRTNHSHHVQ